MMSVLDPLMNARVSLRYALLMFPLSFGFYHLDTVSWYFLVESSIVNLGMSYYAVKFWYSNNDKNAKALFFISLVHLPLFLIFLMVHKKQQVSVVEDAVVVVAGECPEKPDFSWKYAQRFWQLIKSSFLAEVEAMKLFYAEHVSGWRD